ncbi:MAG: Gfo/Idh/MocA family protein [Stackebrandtia sp.]
MSVGVGVIGAGVISDTYLANLTGFPDLRVLRVADLVAERAAAQAAKHGVAGSGTVVELLVDPDIDIVVNLTIPAAHATVSAMALDAGKHVWQEKPLALDRDSARDLLAHARALGLRVACAPDTVLGAGLQTARRAIEAGRIGESLMGLALFQSPGPESWHPSPQFLFQKGSGPLFDIGPYYVTELVHLFGPVRRVTAAGGRARDTRVIGSGPDAGTSFAVTVPTGVSALVEFERGGSAQLLLSFDSALSRAGMVEVTGTRGTAVVPDPNRFDGATTLHLLGEPEPLLLDPQGHNATRGVGVVDLARAVAAGTVERASGDLAFHTLDVMLCIDESLHRRTSVDSDSTVDVPPTLPHDWDPYERTLD